MSESKGEIIQFNKDGKIIIPEKICSIQATIIPTNGAAGLVETTTDLVSVIRDGSATPDSWPWGVVSEIQSHTCKPPSGIRLNQTLPGNLKLTLRGQ